MLETADYSLEKEMGVPTVRALSRGLYVMEVLSKASTALGPSSIAQAAGLDRATTSRLLQTLVDDGYVAKLRHGNYALTPKLLEISSRFGIDFGLREIARPVMRELRDVYGETVHLGVLKNDRIIYIEKIEPNHQRIGLITAVGETMPVHSTSLGKAILSAMPDSDLNEILGRLKLDARTALTITTKKGLLSEIANTRKLGYAVDHGENLEGASCVAAPIMNTAGGVIAALSISSPTSRIASSVAEIGPAVRAAASKISNTILGI